MEFIPVNEPLLNGNEKSIYASVLIQAGFHRRDHS